MARPTSFRLPEELLTRLEEASHVSGTTVTALVTTILDEGLKTKRFPGIVYRDGPAGRRAGLLGGPDVWEIVRDLRRSPGRGMKRIEHLANEVGMPVTRVRLAADFAAEYSDEITALVDADARAAERVRRLVDQRERLLS